jgi:hypothetical protein
MCRKCLLCAKGGGCEERADGGIVRWIEKIIKSLPLMQKSLEKI